VSELIEREPGEARWHEKQGDALRVLQRAPDAAAAYREAARLYLLQGLSGHAATLKRLADGLESGRSDPR
jgi:hypothetical protein